MMHSTSIVSSDDSSYVPMPVVRCVAAVDLLESTEPLCKSITPLHPPPPSAPTPHHLTTLDHLSYLQLLGQGAQGAVYRVHDNRTNECLALKIVNMPRNKSDLSVVMYERDAAVFAMESGIKGVVQAKEIFQDSGRCFILMRLGRATLYDEARAYNKKMPIQRIAFVTYDIAERLFDMHSKGMIHRDIKPENILIDSSGSSWIADLGMAHFESKTTTGFCGTYEYMAPEVKYDSYNTQADVWSLGVMLFCLLLNRYPFEHDDRKMIPDVAGSTHLPLQPGEISPEAEDLLRRMLTVDPNSRITMQGVLEHDFFPKVFNSCSEEEFESAQYPHPSLRQSALINDMEVKSMRSVIEPSRYPGKYLPGYNWTAKKWTVEAEDVIALAGQGTEDCDSDGLDDIDDEELKDFEIVFVPPPGLGGATQAKAFYIGAAPSLSQRSSVPAPPPVSRPMTRLAYLDSSESYPEPGYASTAPIVLEAHDCLKTPNDEQCWVPGLFIASSTAPMSPSHPSLTLPSLPSAPLTLSFLSPNPLILCSYYRVEPAETPSVALPVLLPERKIPEPSNPSLLLPPTHYVVSSSSRVPSPYWSRRSQSTAATSCYGVHGSVSVPQNRRVKMIKSISSPFSVLPAPSPAYYPLQKSIISSISIFISTNLTTSEVPSKADRYDHNARIKKFKGLRRFLGCVLKRHLRESCQSPPH